MLGVAAGEFRLDQAQPLGTDQPVLRFGKYLLAYKLQQIGGQQRAAFGDLLEGNYGRPLCRNCAG